MPFEKETEDVIWLVGNTARPDPLTCGGFCLLSKKRCLILISICLPTTLYSSVNLGIDNVAVSFFSQ